MATTQTERALLLNFSSGDARHSVSRKTVKEMGKHLGIKSETQIIQYALSQLAREILPTYEQDDGMVNDQTIQAIERIVPPQEFTQVESLF